MLLLITELQSTPDLEEGQRDAEAELYIPWPVPDTRGSHTPPIFQFLFPLGSCSVSQKPHRNEVVLLFLKRLAHSKHSVNVSY